MTDDIDEWLNDIHVGDARETLSELPESSVHMMMTSPPYFGLRDYDADGQIGLEDSLDEYISELVGVFREVRRVLRPDGSAWLNLGDSYGADKQKQLVPHRVAIALQADGWVVRNDCTWVKPNPMPQSVKDRLNTTTEQVFYLRPQPDGWFDLDAIREPHQTSEHHEKYHNETGSAVAKHSEHSNSAISGDHGSLCHPAGKNPGDVFEVTTKPFPEAHFAVYPPELCEKPIKATCPPRVCADCGAPYEREVGRETVYDHDTTAETDLDRDRNDTDGGDGHDLRNGVYSDATFERWSPTCDCDTDATAPGIALDPFAGAGTTARVAKDLGRRFIGIDLNPDYVAMAQKRVGVTVNEPDRLLDDDDATTLQAYTDGGGGDD